MIAKPFLMKNKLIFHGQNLKYYILIIYASVAAMKRVICFCFAVKCMHTQFIIITWHSMHKMRFILVKRPPYNLQLLIIRWSIGCIAVSWFDIWVRLTGLSLRTGACNFFFCKRYVQIKKKQQKGSNTYVL